MVVGVRCAGATAVRTSQVIDLPEAWAMAETACGRYEVRSEVVKVGDILGGACLRTLVWSDAQSVGDEGEGRPACRTISMKLR